MLNFHTMTVREIALSNPATTRVFEEYKIDYCCHGNVVFDDACRDAGACPDEVIEKIDGILVSANTEFTWLSTASLSELMAHIVEKHHVYTREETDQLGPLMEKVANRHGEHYPFLLRLRDLFQLVCNDLGPHMMKEELVLFPYIQDLESNYSKGIQGTFPPFGTVNNPVRMMRSEHEEVGALLEKMRDVTDNYTLPEGACPSFTALYSRLEALEKDLHQHIHLENNLLFPRAVELEQKTFPLAVG